MIFLRFLQYNLHENSIKFGKNSNFFLFYITAINSKIFNRDCSLYKNMDVKKLVEAVLFASDEPLKASEISSGLRIDSKTVYRAIKDLKNEYDEKGSAIEIVKVGQRYIMQLREGYRDIAAKFGKPELDKDVLKTLAVIAYYQPIKQSVLRELVGEKVYEHVDILKRKRLVTSRTQGRTEILSVTKNFSTYFGIDARDPQGIKKYLAERLNLKLEG